MQGPFSTVSRVLVPTLILLSHFPGFISPAVITLKSIEMYSMHEWVKHPATIYFRCNGENETVLPDVTEANVLHSFSGEESWQPLTELPSKKCKRCGVYRKELWAPNAVFDEWELCPSDFVAPNGICIHFKEKEFNATFTCKDCLALARDSHSSDSKGGANYVVIFIVLISLAVAAVVVAGSVAGYRYWLKRKRQQEQARFLRLFEEGDDIEDELGLGYV